MLLTFEVLLVRWKQICLLDYAIVICDPGSSIEM